LRLIARGQRSPALPNKQKHRKENWLQEAWNHAEKVLRHIEATRIAAIQEGGLNEPDRIHSAILKALTPNEKAVQSGTKPDPPL